MFFQKKTMSLYLTHGSILTMKGAAYIHSKDEPHIIALCALTHGEKTYTITNIESLLIKIIHENHAQKKHLVELAESHQSASFNQADFDDFVHQIKIYFKINHLKLHADGNLFWPTSNNVSTELCYLVRKIQPQSLILFSDTPACNDDSQNYLDRKLTTAQHQLPHYRLSGAIATRKTLKNVIAREAVNPTYIPTQNSCFNFFSNKTKRLLRAAPIYPTDDTAIVSLHSDIQP